MKILQKISRICWFFLIGEIRGQAYKHGTGYTRTYWLVTGTHDLSKKNLSHLNYTVSADGDFSNLFHSGSTARIGESMEEADPDMAI